MSNVGGLPFGLEVDACPICGTVNGACGPHDGTSDRPKHLVFEEWGQVHRTPEQREPSMADVVATERIWENVPVVRSERTRRVLRYKVGDVVPEDRAKALNVKADGTQSKVPTADAPEGASALANTVQTPPKPAKRAATRTTKKAPARKTTAKKTAARKR